MSLRRKFSVTDKQAELSHHIEVAEKRRSANLLSVPRGRCPPSNTEHKPCLSPDNQGEGVMVPPAISKAQATNIVGTQKATPSRKEYLSTKQVPSQSREDSGISLSIGSDKESIDGESSEEELEVTHTNNDVVGVQKKKLENLEDPFVDLLSSKSSARLKWSQLNPLYDFVRGDGVKLYDSSPMLQSTTAANLEGGHRQVPQHHRGRPGTYL